ncbi:MAG: endonuclease III [Planctomycetota bacterium]|jgi:endonuclease-3
MTTVTVATGSTSKASFHLPKKSAAQTARARRILKALYKHYPDAHCELDYSSPHELLVATILSAQATDVGVNKATPALFKRFPAPADYAAASPAEIEPFVRSLGFFRNKARAVHESMKTVAEEFGGRVPDSMADLLTLRGVARKTANVVLGNAYGKNEGVVVDTHVSRLAQRLGLTKHTDPAKIEHDLMGLFPRRHWTMLSHLLIWHGRRVCKARAGSCADHPLCRAYCSNARASVKSAGSKKPKAKKQSRSRTGSGRG